MATMLNNGYYQAAYQPYVQQYAPQYQQQSNVLPPQQVLQANGKASIDALRMSPNSSALIMDSTAPIVWLCTSDSLGNVSSTPYDISQHKDTPPVDMGSVETRLATVEASINQIWEVMNNASKPDAGSIKPKQTVRPDGTDRPD